MQEESPESIVAAVKAHGWQQGDILPAAARTELKIATKRNLETQQICIVVTHSCDLDRPDPTVDVEVVLATPTGKKLDGGFTHGRSRKKLQIEIAAAGVRQSVEIEAAGRYNLPIAILAHHGPDVTRSLADTEQREILIEWLVARYARPGFPNAFEHRMSAQRKALDKTAKKLLRVWRIYVGLSAWHDLPDRTPYIIKIFFVIHAEDYENINTRQETLEAVGDFLKVLSQCRGIEVAHDAQQALVPDDDFTYTRSGGCDAGRASIS